MTAKESAAAKSSQAQSAEGESDDALVFENGIDGGKLKSAIFSVPIEVVVSVGTARPLIGDLLKMERDFLLPLDASLTDPVELRVKDKVIARGELTQSEDGSGKLGIRITEIADIADIL